MSLSVHDLHAGYGKKTVVRGASLEVGLRQIVALIGHNGAGKSTLLNAVFGLNPPSRGSVSWNGADLTASDPRAKVLAGIAYAPQGPQVYRTLTVTENLRLGAYALHDAEQRRRNLDRVYALFPTLHDRRDAQAGSLSGGERQMVAMGAILATGPKLVLLDEPSGGLAPLMVEKLFGTVRRMADEFGIAVLLVEQNVREAFRIADRAYLLAAGSIVATGSPRDPAESERLRDAYLGRGPVAAEPGARDA